MDPQHTRLPRAGLLLHIAGPLRIAADSRSANPPGREVQNASGSATAGREDDSYNLRYSSSLSRQRRTRRHVTPLQACFPAAPSSLVPRCLTPRPAPCRPCSDRRDPHAANSTRAVHPSRCAASVNLPFGWLCKERFGPRNDDQQSPGGRGRIDRPSAVAFLGGACHVGESSLAGVLEELASAAAGTGPGGRRRRSRPVRCDAACGGSGYRSP